jgi:hypothetical protein
MFKFGIFIDSLERFYKALYRWIGLNKRLKFKTNNQQRLVKTERYKLVQIYWFKIYKKYGLSTNKIGTNIFSVQREDITN